MDFADFHVELRPERRRCDLQQLEHQVHADAHVGCDDEADLFARGAQKLPLARREPGGADHHADVKSHARLQMDKGRGGTGEIDQDPGIAKCLVRVRRHHYARGPAEGSAGVLTGEGRSISHERAR